MAIPKLCGIENEFGFSVFRIGDSVPLSPESDEYLLAVSQFLGDFLKKNQATQHIRSFESRDIALSVVDDDYSVSSQELDHRRRLLQLGINTDGFLKNGARFYLDDSHPEYSTPECLTPSDLVAQDKASEEIMLAALEEFSGKARYRLVVHKNNCDDSGHSYGSHLNILLKREAVQSRESARYLIKQYIPFQIARLVLCGSGRAGFENGRPPCSFQLSQRADFFSRLVSIDTMHDRPIFNLRDEPHGEFKKYFRIHDISNDALLCEIPIFLKVALSQIVVAMIEDRFLEENRFPVQPVEAFWQVSRDINFNSSFLLEDGRNLTGLELLRLYLSDAERYLKGRPMKEEHKIAVKLAIKILEKLQEDKLSLFGFLDWPTVLGLIESRPSDAKANTLWFREISDRSLYRVLLKKGKIKRFISDEDIKRACVDAPENTRAYLRGQCLKRFGDRVLEIDWSRVSLRNGKGYREYFSWDNPLLDKRRGDMVLSYLESLMVGGPDA